MEAAETSIVHAQPLITDEEAVHIGEGGLVVRDGFLPPSLGHAAREHLEAWYRRGRLKPAGTGRDGTRSSIRGDRTTWLEPHDPPPLSDVFACFEALRLNLAQQLRLGLPRFTVQAARYAPGAGYQRHVDALRGDARRVITAIVYLNPDWHQAHAGQLRAWTPDDLVEVEPLLGRLVLFRANAVPHEVVPTLRTRWAVTAWYRGPEPIPLVADPPS